MRDPVVAKACQDRKRARARAYVASVRARTVCAKCGRQPIDWHCEAHNANHKLRISQMAGFGRSIASIRAEIDRCTPLCRRCHMVEDGRLAKFKAQRDRNSAARWGVLTEDQQREIREWRGTKTAIAQKFGVHINRVTRIQRRAQMV